MNAHQSRWGLGAEALTKGKDCYCIELAWWDGNEELDSKGMLLGECIALEGSTVECHAKGRATILASLPICQLLLLWVLGETPKKAGTYSAVVDTLPTSCLNEHKSVQYCYSGLSDSLWPHGLYSTPAFAVHHQLPELAKTRILWLGDVIQPSHPLSSPSPPAFSLP